MTLSIGSLSVFWSNGLVAMLMVLTLPLVVRPLLSRPLTVTKVGQATEEHR